MNSDQVLDEFRDAEALLEGHFILSSGLHSRTYFAMRPRIDGHAPRRASG
jgi:orotate phosphoribosyltransferase